MPRAGDGGENERCVWITFVGVSLAAICNTIWMCYDLDILRPNVFYLIYNEKTRDLMYDARDLISEICKTYGIPNPQIAGIKTKEDDLDQISREIRKILKFETKKGSRIAVDLTPGRKYMTLILAIIAAQFNVDHAFYLHLKDPQYQNELYPRIPQPLQELYDLNRILKEGIGSAFKK
ncbi:MAG: CRISPR-associated ring nuclease [Candidatus Baldrarchaeia archaeon]